MTVTALETRPDPVLRQQEAFRQEMSRLAGWFPAPDTWQQEHQCLRVPVAADLIAPGPETEAFRREVVQRLIDTAAAIAAAKPEGAAHGRVAAVVDWPMLTGSELCVFFDRGYERSFAPETDRKHGRTYWPGGWVSSQEPEANLFDQLGVTLPEGFAPAGIALTEYSKDTDHTYRYERWVAMETLERIA
ncbi:DUF3916 domain-containing protein [Pseudodonghicola flavimaris]|uniref:DUF3916 domain-containing protein n=1 Tax=Pseudodonghicola flavimaris TaxID=3050036 RepID=A0ABT7EZL2_9RHOB|nr:DUF3916 domain-containing protein [Pseudodonghicola flavimaris]MDK3017786.1 DUF3916 domain-containing protein [Pseudodonghicola flavimaris]